ncbi:LPS assembly protein LptD [Vibrio vulnificus]|nr:LPS assembly protein LptD [Vibrio vulnificus]EIO3980624.1 LPS assembly protein LptD [Vibrio vulnificus]
MQHFSRTFLAASIATALFAPYAQAEAILNNSVQEMPTTDQCLVDAEKNDANAEIVIQADNLQAINGDKAIYSGDVEVTQGNKKITAESVTLHQQENIVVAEGNVTFNDGEVKASSSKVTNNMTSETFSLENTEYQFLCQQGRGQAAYIAKTGQAVYELEDGSITSCPADDNAWRLVASSIEVDQDEETATFYHPRFEVLDVPVFYAPYLTLPIGNTRKTGFLFPSVNYGSSDGLEIEVPFYWNIAPNYDLTLTTLYMQQRGVKQDADFRYLSDGWGSGELKGEYLPGDEKYNDEDRWGYQYKHDGIINKQWLVSLDYSQVSDIDYFRDLSSDLGNREDGQLMQQGKVAYRSDFWDMSLQVRDFQILLQDNNQPYRLLPQVKFNFYTPLLGNYLNFDVKSELTQFDIQDASKPNALRAHVEPGLTIPLSTSWATWTTEARLLATYYQQDLDRLTDPTLKSQLDETVARVIPEYRSHARIYLEREAKLFEGYTQSLEPQIQYLYVPEEEQGNIYNYDTTLLQTDYYGLFRSRKYSSIDKIAAANQLSYGASTRFFDDEYKERLNISFGQIYYIDKKTKLTGNQEETSNYSSWAVETDFNYEDFLFYHGGIQYDIDLNAMQLANSTLEYQFTDGFVQGNYRYVTKDYIEDTISFDELDKITRKGISQAGIVGAYNINRHWSASGQYYYDLTEEIDLEWMASLRYQSDCWYIGFTYTNQLVKWRNDVVGGDSNNPVYDTNISVNFGIQGFATKNKAETAAKELDSTDNAITYGRPFYLNN